MILQLMKYNANEVKIAFYKTSCTPCADVLIINRLSKGKSMMISVSISTILLLNQFYSAGP